MIQRTKLVRLSLIISNLEPNKRLISPRRMKYIKMKLGKMIKRRRRTRKRRRTPMRQKRRRLRRRKLRLRKRLKSQIMTMS